ncbi:ankyrin repeat and SAM domain-containing protein 6-like [Planococcus citri]|uniref:ankyrin repeat and SAM domain-containing protein 6-like n=1 Tax=Planococcus citri TaxID=170843 RepID=UPI0031F835EE
MDLCTASALGIQDFVTTNLKRDPAQALYTNDKSWTPLMYACIYCREHIVSAIVNMVPSSIYSINDKMQTSLMLSCKSGDLNIVKLLTKKEILECKDTKGWTALFYAVIYDHVDIICYLMRKGADVNARDYSSCTLLMTAVKQGKENIVELLLGFGADYQMTTNTGLKAIDIAFELKYFKLVNLLSIPAATNLESLMHCLCLDKYTPVFTQQGIDLNQFLKFSEDDLKRIGINLLGPRRKMSLAIYKLNYLKNLELRLQDKLATF